MPRKASVAARMGPDSPVSTVEGGSMMRARPMFLGAVFLSSVAGPVLAHHSAAMFDATQERVVQGVVTDFAWKNREATAMSCSVAS